MNTAPILIELSAKGVSVGVEGSELVLKAPKGTLTSFLVSKVKKAKPALMSSLDEIREKIGPEWEEISKNPAELRAFLNLLAISKMRERGIAPDHYTSTTTCKHCGPVPIWQGCPPEVLGCPWCFNRLEGLPIPVGKGEGST